MLIDENDPYLSFLPISGATVPPAGLIKHIKNHYWVIHPKRGLVFWKTHYPQCNVNIEITRKFVSPDGMYPWGIIVFVPSVFICINPRDYV